MESDLVALGGGADVQHEILTAYARALGREAHVLARSPDLLWQQLHNRLQWEGEEVEAGMAPERARRSRPEATPWLRVATPLRESEALLRTLTGHTGDVYGCAFSPDGHQIVSASADHTLKVWDTVEGSGVAQVEFPGSLECVSWHPSLPWVACGDPSGGLCRVEVMGIEHRPIVLTATDRGRGLVVRCPACQSDHPLERSGLGSDLSCVTEGCGLNLHVNTFVVTPQ